jgi:hypothetical protein
MLRPDFLSIDRIITFTPRSDYCKAPKFTQHRAPEAQLDNPDPAGDPGNVFYYT